MEEAKAEIKSLMWKKSCLSFEFAYDELVKGKGEERKFGRSTFSDAWRQITDEKSGIFKVFQRGEKINDNCLGIIENMKKIYVMDENRIGDNFLSLRGMVRKIDSPSQAHSFQNILRTSYHKLNERDDYVTLFIEYLDRIKKVQFESNVEYYSLVFRLLNDFDSNVGQNPIPLTTVSVEKLEMIIDEFDKLIATGNSCDGSDPLGITTLAYSIISEKDQRKGVEIFQRIFHECVSSAFLEEKLQDRYKLFRGLRILTCLTNSATGVLDSLNRIDKENLSLEVQEALFNVRMEHGSDVYRYAQSLISRF